MMSVQRVGACLVWLLLLNQGLMLSAFAAPGDQIKDLPLKEAVQLGIKNSQEIRDARSEITKKNAELVQAQYAVQSEDAKDSSLFAKPRNLSKDLQIRLKVPEARKQQLVANEALRSKTLSVQYEMEKLYGNALQGLLAENAAQKKLDAAKVQLESIRNKQKFGLADQAARDQAEKGLEQAASSLKLAQLSYKSSLLALGDKVGMDLQGGVKLSYIQDYGDLNQAMLEKYSATAQKTNLSLLQDREDRRIADMKVDVSRKLYASKFGEARMRVIESMYKAKDIDYELFMAGYEATLAGIQRDWEGFMWLAIFPIPKVLLQGEYDGIRYFDDIRQSLPISMMDQNKAVLKEKESLKNVVLSIRQSYLDAKGAEEAYAQSLRDRDKAAAAVAAAAQKAKLGFMKAEELQLVLDAKDQAELMALNSWISYKQALGKLNVDTGGAVEPTYKVGILPYRDIDDGLAKINPSEPEAKGPGGSWSIKPKIGTLVSEFSLKVDKKLDVTDYALFTTEGNQIGKKEPIQKPLSDLSILFSDPEGIRVILYRDMEIVAESIPEGYGAAGTLKLDPPGEFAAKPAVTGAVVASKKGEATVDGGTTLMIGTYRIALDALTPELHTAAKGTMAESGQGILVKSELTGGVWVSADQVLNLQAMENPKGNAVIGPEKLAALKLTVDVGPNGQLAPLLTAAQMNMELETLKKEQEQLKLDKEKALAANKAADTLLLSIKLKEAETKSILLQTLLSDNQAVAIKQIALLNNPEALAKQLEADAAAAGGPQNDGSGAGTGGAAAGGSNGANNPDATGVGAGAGTSTGASDAIKQAELEQRQQELEKKVRQAIASGDTQTAELQLASLMDTASRLAVSDRGSDESIKALQSALIQLQDAQQAAQVQKDTGRIEQLQGSITSLNFMLLTVQKESLFAKLDTINGLSAKLLKDAQGNLSAMAQLPPALAGQLEKESRQTLAQIGRIELGKYTPEQMQELTAATVEIEQSWGERARIFPVESVISPNLIVFFPAPPVIINEKVFLPVRPVSEAFGAMVMWDEEQQSVTISQDRTTIVCRIDNQVGYVNGEPVDLDTKPVMIAGRTYVPLRFVAEMLDMQIDWDNGTKTIRISAE
ncbi:Outer membrane protein TolC [Paenibacillus sp. 1_12]|uniref:stalk domain-containing protein n=1 Tax=Paenibacillus sp. 1_12 TaxID=1566278 RepID=UPI0008F0A89F|nr:stalk domain-containing protein [Paenibacillus sp. 1_12]SFM02193.1 Outer membrane protein TolC [Paenibacillus sp. 1_12]